MNKPILELLFHGLLPPIILGVFIIVAARNCTASITQYDGWIHRCEERGGVPHGGKCFDPSALIDPEEPTP